MCKGPLATASHRQIFHLETVYAITSLGKERANLSAFRMFDRFVLVWVCQFPLPLDVWEGLRFVIVALPWTFLLPFLLHQKLFGHQELQCTMSFSETLLH